MRVAVHLSFPIVCAVAYLWFSLGIFEADRGMEWLLWGSLVLAIAVAGFLVHKVRLEGLFLTVFATAVFFLTWSLLWASAEEFYIHQFTMEEQGTDGWRYLYPGHSGMGYADGFVRYHQNVVPILLASLVIGTSWGTVLAIVRKLKALAQGEESLESDPSSLDGRWGGGR